MKYAYDSKFTEMTLNLLRWPAKNYHNRPWFDKVIAKVKWCSFFTRMADAC